jgi:hypothetical protein
VNQSTHPEYARLPVIDNAPPGASWGVFGPHDQLGTVNFMTPDRVAAAARLVRKGTVFNLDLPLEIPHPPFYGRHVLKHEIVVDGGIWRDTVLHNFNTQTSSQIDGLRHYCHPRWGFYGGRKSEEATETGGPNGIEHWARRGIAGRGVLIDVGRYFERRGAPLDQRVKIEIDLATVREVLREQRTEVRPGDILLFRFGWTPMYLGLDEASRKAMSENHEAPGLAHSREIAGWFWDNQVVQAWSDTPALEAIPHPLNDESLHDYMICRLGMGIGELLDFEGLAADCASDGVYECFVTSSPLYVTGGVATPPNALAFK